MLSDWLFCFVLMFIPHFYEQYIDKDVCSAQYYLEIKTISQVLSKYKDTN